MNDLEYTNMISNAKTFFRDVLAPAHLAKMEEVAHLASYNINPFLIKYLANFIDGEATPRSIAKALIYPRVLGTSINTIFGSKVQSMIRTVFSGMASTTAGIDIEYIDPEDGHRKYCQLKAGPNTINKDDVTTIKNHFRDVINLGRTNGIRIASEDMVIGVLYGTIDSVSTFYKKIGEDYTLLVGADLWTKITGRSETYSDLISAFEEVAEEINGSRLLNDCIDRLTDEIREKGI